MARKRGGTGEAPQPAAAAPSRETDHFEGWITRYGDYYPHGSRLDLEYRTSRMLVLAGRSWVTRIDNILRAETGQTRARWQVLFALAFGEQPVTMTEIGKRVRVQWPTLVRVLDGMIADDLLESATNPADGRSKLVQLTPHGHEVIRQIQPILDRERSQLLSDLSTEELKLCSKMLNRLFESAINE